MLASSKQEKEMSKDIRVKELEGMSDSDDPLELQCLPEIQAQAYPHAIKSAQPAEKDTEEAAVPFVHTKNSHETQKSSTQASSKKCKTSHGTISKPSTSDEGGKSAEEKTKAKGKKRRLLGAIIRENQAKYNHFITKKIQSFSNSWE